MIFIDCNRTSKTVKPARFHGMISEPLEFYKLKHCCIEKMMDKQLIKAYIKSNLH
jgi:hypothetical protein